MALDIDLNKFFQACDSALLRKQEVAGCQSVIRRVEYNEKDLDLLIPSIYADPTETPLEIWKRASFTKPAAYIHEKEIRILLVDRHNIVRLPDAVQPFFITDGGIAASIVDAGTF